MSWWSAITNFVEDIYPQRVESVNDWYDDFVESVERTTGIDGIEEMV